MYSAEVMNLGLDKLTKDNLKAFAQMMEMPMFGKKENKAEIAKKVEKHLIWAFDNAKDYY